jgi:hypothetical protein
VLFFDDVCLVGEHARLVGSGFVGLPSHAPFSWQRQSMELAGLPLIVDSLHDIGEDLLRRVDRMLGVNAFWT